MYDIKSQFQQKWKSLKIKAKPKRAIDISPDFFTRFFWSTSGLIGKDWRWICRKDGKEKVAQTNYKHIHQCKQSWSFKEDDNEEEVDEDDEWQWRWKLFPGKLGPSSQAQSKYIFWKMYISHHSTATYPPIVQRISNTNVYSWKCTFPNTAANGRTDTLQAGWQKLGDRRTTGLR